MGASFRKVLSPEWLRLKNCLPARRYRRPAQGGSMNKKNARNKIGGSLLFTLALIALTYLLLPNGESVGASPRTPQATSTTQTLAASVRADQRRARMALGQLPL